MRVALGLASLDLLRPHEEFVESHVREIMESLTSLGTIMRPILVDQNSGTVLDGAHRLEALRRLGARLAPVAAVDYMSAEVRLEGWARIYDASAFESIRRLSALREIRHLGNVTVAYLDGLESYYDLKVVEEDYELRGVVKPSELRSVTGGTLVVIPPRPTKELVLRAAVTEKLLPPRSTRHVTLAKRISLKFRLDRLRGSGSEP